MRGRQAEGAICYAVLALQAALSVETEEEQKKSKRRRTRRRSGSISRRSSSSCSSNCYICTHNLLIICLKIALQPRCLRHQRLNGFFCHFCFKVKLFRIILQCSQVANSVKRQLHKLPTNSRPLSPFPLPLLCPLPSPLVA